MADFLEPILPMNEPASSEGDPRIYMAAERTFLAWLRTGIALMGFGFVVARFGLFLREIADSQAAIKLPHSNFSLPAGIVLIALGIVVTIIAAFRHRRFIRAIDCGQFRQVFGANFVFWLAGLLGLTGVAVAVYLASLFY